MYWIACVLDPRIKIKWIEKNYLDIEEIIARIKGYLKKAYIPEEQLLVSLIGKQEKFRVDIEMEFLQEYGSAVSADDDIERYFNSPQVSYVADKSVTQV
jgi:hypothetical protein